MPTIGELCNEWNSTPEPSVELTALVQSAVLKQRVFAVGPDHIYPVSETEARKEAC